MTASGGENAAELMRVHERTPARFREALGVSTRRFGECEIAVKNTPQPAEVPELGLASSTILAHDDEWQTLSQIPGEPLMTKLIVLWLGLAIIRPLDRPVRRSPIRVFADLKHTGALAGPLTSVAMAPNEFVIAAPLPARSPDRDRSREKFEPATSSWSGWVDCVSRRPKGAGELVVSIDSDIGRFLRLFRKSKSGWRRMAPSERPVMDGGTGRGRRCWKSAWAL